MRTGRLSISRGHQLQETPDRDPAPPPPHLTLVPPASADYQIVHDRLTALERLTRLFELGTLSAEEFAAEKALILALPADELVLRDLAPVHFVPVAPRRAPQRGPSLLGRMLSWKFVLFSLVVGLAFSFATQPNETRHLFDQTLRLFGA
ncbi:MAG: hypothetical protein QOG13_1896 [Sphingomonadales bacterium]|jgi:hypothetical protein|nr:hypothetical protein [Sphingomonadales bacterium]